ncbi:thermonuclease family protein [Rummeliibacillus sp. JY-2-4R]
MDTPESTYKIEPYGKTASKYTCSKLKNAKKIQSQYDGPKKDKYGRTLVWVFVDGKLLQESLVKKGYVEKSYDYGTYSC